MMWNRCDELTMPYYLTASDWCAYHEQYFQGDFNSSTGNQLIANFKMDISCVNSPFRWRYKLSAIRYFANLLIQSSFTPGTILIPAPTSKMRSSPLFDSRLDEVGRLFSTTRTDIKVVPCLDCRQDQTANHNDPKASRRPDIIVQNLVISPNIPVGTKRAYVFDDVLTTGGHFSACKQLIQRSYPDVDVRGIFLALRIFSPPPG